MNDLTAMKAETSNMGPRELSLDELDDASGGLAWIPLVAVGLFVTGILYRMFTRT